MPLPREAKELSLKVYIQSLRHYRRQVVAIFCLTLVVVGLWSASLRKTYSATATIMNISDSNRSGAGTPFLQMVGISKSLNEGFFKFIAIINSRTFKEMLADSLTPEFFTPKKGWKGSKEGLRNFGVGILSKAIKVKVEPEETNVLNIVVEMEDSQKPPIVANELLVVLQKYISNNSLTEGKRLSHYIEGNILETKAAIFEMSQAMASFYKNYPITPEKAMVPYPLRKEILELESKNYNEFSSDPLLKDSFGALEEQKEVMLKKLNSIKETSQKSYFEYLQEEYQILKEINLTLRQQYEFAKLEAVKQEPTFQILDKAAGASYTGPRYKMIFYWGCLIGLLASNLYVLFRLFYFPPPERGSFQLKNQ